MPGSYQSQPAPILSTPPPIADERMTTTRQGTVGGRVAWFFDEAVREITNATERLMHGLEIR